MSYLLLIRSAGLSLYVRMSRESSQVYSTERAFAALLTDGSVIAWGHANYGGDSSAVQADAFWDGRLTF